MGHMETAMNEFDALLGMGITDEEQLKALSESLRGKKRAADFFAVTQIPQIQKAAQAEQKAILGSAEQAGVLKRALEERRLKESEGEKNRENALLRTAMMAQTRGSSNVDPTQPGTTKNVGRWINRETKEEAVVGFRQGVPINLTTQEPINLDGWVEQSPMSEHSTIRTTRDAAKTLGDISRMIGRMSRIDEVVQPYIDKGVPIEDIPGLGLWEKMPLIGAVTRGVQDLMDSKGAPQAEVYQAVMGLMNTINRMQAGLTQTKGEMERIQAETGMDVFTDPQAFIESFSALRSFIDRDLSLARASIPPRIWQELKSEYPEDEFPLFDWSAEDTELDFPESNKTGGFKEAVGFDEGMGAATDIVWDPAKEQRLQELLRKKAEYEAEK